MIIALAYLIIQGRREHPPEKLYVNRVMQETAAADGGEEQTEADNETEEK